MWYSKLLNSLSQADYNFPLSIRFEETKNKKTEFFSEKTKSILKYSNLELENFFNVKVGLLESFPILYNDKTPRVFYMPGWGGPGGISEDMLPNRKYINANYVILQVQWPGTSRFIKLDDGSGFFCESEAIPGDSYKEIAKYYKALFLKLKEKAGGKLRIVAHSNGGLKAVLTYLNLSAQERQDITLSLIDPFMPGYAFCFKKFYRIMQIVLRIMNAASPAYTGSFRDNLILPFTIPARVIRLFFNFTFGIFYKVMDNYSFKSNQIAELILNSFEEQDQILNLLAKTPDQSIDITEILVMTKRHITGDGFGTRKPYLELLQEKFIPKLSKRPDGSKVELEKIEFGHTNFVGINTATEFWIWLEESLKREASKVKS